MTTQNDKPVPPNTRGLCLLSLDGGGVIGLSTFLILTHLSAKFLKPCDVFALTGCTSKGGYVVREIPSRAGIIGSFGMSKLNFIMLGHLEMDVKCIMA